MFVYSAHGFDARRFDALHFFCGEPAPHSGFEYVLQRFYSLMRFSQQGIFARVNRASISLLHTRQEVALSQDLKARISYPFNESHQSHFAEITTKGLAGLMEVNEYFNLP